VAGGERGGGLGHPGLAPASGGLCSAQPVAAMLGRQPIDSSAADRFYPKKHLYFREN